MRVPLVARYQHFLWTVALCLADLVVVVGGLQLALWWRSRSDAIDPSVQVWSGLVALLFLAAMLAAGAYRQHERGGLAGRLHSAGLGWVATVAIAFLVAYFAGLAKPLPRLAVGPWVLWCSVALPANRLAAWTIARLLRRNGIGHEGVVLIGPLVALRRQVALWAEDEGTALRPVALLVQGEDDPRILPTVPRLSRIEDLAADCARLDAGRVVVVVPLAVIEVIVAQVRAALLRTAVLVSCVLTMDERTLVGLQVGQLAGQPVLDLDASPWSPGDRLIKRCEDLALGLPLLVLFAVPMLVIAVAVRLSGPGPLLFVQARHGLHGRPIRVLKFRTMAVATDGQAEAGHETRADGRFAAALPGDLRVTSLGRWLRRTSLDELPQLWNVVRGEMSLVGPRPHALEMNQQWAERLPELMVRHCVKPGITGLAQVSGARGRADLTSRIRRRIDYDLEYIRRWSLWLDLSILLRTALTGFWTREP